MKLTDKQYNLFVETIVMNHVTHKYGYNGTPLNKGKLYRLEQEVFSEPKLTKIINEALVYYNFERTGIEEFTDLYYAVLSEFNYFILKQEGHVPSDSVYGTRGLKGRL